ncbi:hypothetical protein ACWCQL_33130 [Streptomyces sp. NPDC002073]
MADAVAVHEDTSPACLLLGPHTACLHQAVKIWPMVSIGSLADLSIRPTRSGRAGGGLNGVAGELAVSMAQQPPGALVVARHLEGGLIARSHRDHHLPPWEHLPGDRQTLVIRDVDMPAQRVFSTHHPTMQRPQPVENRLLTPCQLLRIQVPEALALLRWRAQAVGAGTACWDWLR